MTPTRIAEDLAESLKPLRFTGPVSHVYNPLVYAWRPHQIYLERYGSGPRQVLLLGMNPGPWGMAQTGVPFGEVAAVRDWMGISASVDRPEPEHPKKPVLGFSCRRSEVSGARLWGWARERYGNAESFFKRFIVLNYCPLLFTAEGGANLTPDKLKTPERERLSALCDAALRRLVLYYKPELVVGVGLFAEEKARESLAGLKLRIGSIPHPSPANPQANKGWARLADEGLRRLGVLA